MWSISALNLDSAITIFDVDMALYLEEFDCKDFGGFVSQIGMRVFGDSRECRLVFVKFRYAEPLIFFVYDFETFHKFSGKAGFWVILPK